VGVPSHHLVSLEDGEMSSLISAHADVKRTSTATPPTSSEQRGAKTEDDNKRRFEILGQLKEFLDSDEMKS